MRSALTIVVAWRDVLSGQASVNPSRSLGRSPHPPPMTAGRSTVRGPNSRASKNSKKSKGSLRRRVPLDNAGHAAANRYIPIRAKDIRMKALKWRSIGRFPHRCHGADRQQICCGCSSPECGLGHFAASVQVGAALTPSIGASHRAISAGVPSRTPGALLIGRFAVVP
jgi:hypothetical protein